MKRKYGVEVEGKNEDNEEEEAIIPKKKRKWGDVEQGRNQDMEEIEKRRVMESCRV